MMSLRLSMQTTAESSSKSGAPSRILWKQWPRIAANASCNNTSAPRRLLKNRLDRTTDQEYLIRDHNNNPVEDQKEET
jgi:hypothetical protein